MSVSNVIVVFQPTLQATHQVLYALIHNTSELFSDIQLTRSVGCFDSKAFTPSSSMLTPPIAF